MIESVFLPRPCWTRSSFQGVPYRQLPRPAQGWRSQNTKKVRFHKQISCFEGAKNLNILDPNTWWKGRRRALISGENLGKRKAAKPRPHWHPKSRAARRPTQLRRRRSNLIDWVVLQSFCVILLVHSSYLCNVYMLGLGGSGLLWLSKAAWKDSTMNHF